MPWVRNFISSRNGSSTIGNIFGQDPPSLLVSAPLADRPRWELVGIAVITGFGGYLLVILWSTLLRSIVGPVTDIANQQILSGAALLLGAITSIRLYLFALNLKPDFLDLKCPVPGDFGWAALGLAALLAISVLLGELNVPTADHSVTTAVRSAGPAVLWVLIPVSVVAVGPAEELLFRNLVQKTLSVDFSTSGAIAGASVIFAIAHVPAYIGSGHQALLASLLVVFGLSCVLGAVYARTESVIVVALVHGAYDAVTFASIFIEWP